MHCDSRRRSCDDLALLLVSFLDRFLQLLPAAAVDKLRLSVSDVLLLDPLHIINNNICHQDVSDCVVITSIA